VCFSATANFVGSGVLAAAGVVTLTRVKHRRELLFASLPTLFAIHQFIEGFVWLGLDGILSPAVTHDMGAAFMLYAQGLLPLLLPLSVYQFEVDLKSRQRMIPFVVLGAATTLYILWALTAFPTEVSVRQNTIVYINQATNNLRLAVFLEDQNDGGLRRGKSGDPAGGHGGQALRLYLVVVRVRGDCQRDHPRLLLEEHGNAPLQIRVEKVTELRSKHDLAANNLAIYSTLQISSR